MKLNSCDKSFFCSRNIVIILIILIIIVSISIILIVVLKKEDPEPIPTPTAISNINTVQEVKTVNSDNKIYIYGDKIVRYDSGLYTRPTAYEGVARHGPKLVVIKK